MWKKPDNEKYNELTEIIIKNMLLKKTEVVKISFEVFLCFLIFFILSLYSIGDNMYILYGCLTAVTLALSIVITIVSVKSYKKQKYKLKENAAEYCEVVLANKIRSEDSITPKTNKLFVVVILNDRHITVRCTEEVFARCQEGDILYLVDMLGTRAANNGACIAVMKDEPESVYAKLNRNRLRFHIRPDQKEIVYKEEYKCIFLHLAPIIGILLLIVLIKFCAVSFPSYHTTTYIFELICWFLLVFMVFSKFQKIAKIISMLKKIKDDEIICERYYYINSEFFQYKYEIIYYYECKEKLTGEVFVLKSRFNFKGKYGQSVFAVFYDKNNVKLYKY